MSSVGNVSGFKKLELPPRRSATSQAHVEAVQRQATHNLLTSLLRASASLYFDCKTGQRFPLLGQLAVIEPLLPEQISTENPQESFIAAIRAKLEAYT